MTDCPFCGLDPYHYVDNGVGMEAVAVTCCEFDPPAMAERLRGFLAEAGGAS